MTAENTGRRVALLAKDGIASERLRAVIDEAGAQCVLAGNPVELEPDALIEAGPQVVLVALDPSTEDALEKFEAVLGESVIDVIYEEAELIGAREGWAVARWQRHLVAKLHGHGDVLPPGREPDQEQQSAPATESQTPPDTTTIAYSFDPINAEFDDGIPDLDLDLDLDPGMASSPQQSAQASPDLLEETFQFEAVYAPPADVAPAPATDFGDFDASFEPGIADESAAGSLAAYMETAVGVESLAPEEATSQSPYSFSELTLDMGDGAAGAADSDEDVNQFQRDIGDLERRISTLELVDDTPVRGPEQVRGAVLVLSGIGGPDAVRQLLGALPRNFSRPVLVQQRLEGGRYDKLVAQMQRATSLPVHLAKTGLVASSGTVYILPLEAGVTNTASGIRFTDDASDDVLMALPPADSALLLLSGSDPGLVDVVMNHKWGGALVAGQAADGCYDPTASNALAARGGETASPAVLALRLTERWSSLGAEDVEA